MKKLLIALLLIIFFCGSTIAESNNRNAELNKLFNLLKESKDSFVANNIEIKIWNIWSTHPTQEELTTLLAVGSKLMSNGKLKSAYNIFSEIIKSSPDWAEGWNKRATVLYLMGYYSESLSDIDETLKLERRHFGALSGKALVQIELKNYEDAISSYKAAQKIYPSIRGARIMIPQLQELIDKEAI